jgi:hypothetical protein
MPASSLDELDIKVYLDYPQERRSLKNPLVYAMDGTSVDASTAFNAYIEPVTRSIMGMPVPMTPSWRTTFSGQGYNRYQLADFTFTSPTSWKNIDFYGTGDTYIYCISNDAAIMNSTISLNGGVKRNRPLFFSFIKQNKKESTTNITAKLFWAGTDFINRDTQLHFKDDGSCDVYRGYILLQGTILATTATPIVTGSSTTFVADLAVNDFIYTEDGRLIGKVLSISSSTSLTLYANANINYAGQYHKKQPKKVQSYSRNENNYNKQATNVSNQTSNNQYNDVYIIPCRGKELIVNTSFGLNFSHSFDDLNEPNNPQPNDKYYAGSSSPLGNTTPAQPFLLPEVLPGGAFSIVIPNGKVAFQLANLFFLSNWEITSKPITNEVAQQGYKNLSYTQYSFRTGSISATPASKTVTGYSSDFDASDVNGRLFWIPGLIAALEVGTVASVASLTSLTLVNNSNVFAQAGGKYFVVKKPAGTITFTTSSNIITGTGTNFPGFLAIGLDIYDAQDRYIGKVASISSATSATIYYNPLFSATNTVFWPALPQIINNDLNVGLETLGPATSTQYTDIIPANAQIYNSTGDIAELSLDDTVFLKIFQASATDPLNFAKNNDSTNIFYSVDENFIFSQNPITSTQVDITSILENLTLERTEDGYLNVGFSARKQSLIDLGITNPEKISNRSLKITLKPRNTNYQEVMIFDGMVNNPSIEYIKGINYDKYALLSFSGHCKKSLLNDVYFSKAPSYDSYPLTETIQRLCKYAGTLGVDDSVGFTPGTISYLLPYNRANSNGQYNYTPVISDSVGSYIEKIRSEIAQNVVFSSRCKWTYRDFYNAYIRDNGFEFNENDWKPSSSLADLYLDEQSANTYGSISIDKAYKRTIRDLQKVYEAPEANQVIVVGIDKSNNDRITSIIDDVNSQNPYASTRPNNWLGMVKTFCYMNDRLTDQYIVSKSAQSFFNRLSTGREIVEFTSDFLTYFDSTSKEINVAYGGNKTGTITTLTNSRIVIGIGTLFTTELSVGQKIYKNDGTYIGKIQTITNNTSLTLFYYAEIPLINEVFSTSPTYVTLYEYDMLDLDDAITLKNLDGTTEGIYKIISYRVDFVKQNIISYTAGIANEPDRINVANATYRAVKTQLLNQNTIIPNEDYNRSFTNVINCLNGTPVKIIQNVYSAGNTLTTLGAPTGMTFSTTSSAYYQDVTINWTPGSIHVGNTYNVTLTLSNVSGSGYTLNIPLTFKVYSTL